MPNLGTEGYGFIPADIELDDIVYAYVPATDPTALGIGSPVAKVGTGNTAVISLGANRVAEAQGLGISSLPTVTHATAGDSNKIWGIVVGVMVDITDFTATDQRPASREAVVKIARALPGSRFRVLSNAAVPAATIGLNANISASSGIVSAFGKSNLTLDISSAAASVAKQFKIVSIGRDPNRVDTTTAGCEIIVEPNVGYDVVADLGV